MVSPRSNTIIPSAYLKQSPYLTTFARKLALLPWKYIYSILLFTLFLVYNIRLTTNLQTCRDTDQLTSAESIYLTSPWISRRLFFVVSAGRTGTNFLASVLSCAQDVVAFHEPKPQINNDDFRVVFLQGNRKESAQSRAEAKLRAVEDALLGSGPTMAYAETSHMFIKTMYDFVIDKAVMEYGAELTIIVLRRNLHDTVRSQVSLGWFRNGHSGLNNWYYDPREIHPSETLLDYNQVMGKYPRLQPNSDPQANMTSSESETIADAGSAKHMARLTHESTSQMQKLLEYNLDIELRAQQLVHQVENHNYAGRIRVVDANVKNLNSVESITHFLTDELNLAVDPKKVQVLLSRDKNERTMKKEKVLLDKKTGQSEFIIDQWIQHSIRHQVDSLSQVGMSIHNDLLEN